MNTSKQLAIALALAAAVSGASTLAAATDAAADTTATGADSDTIANAPRGRHDDRFPIDLKVEEQRSLDRFDLIDSDDDELISSAEFLAAEAAHGEHGFKHRRGSDRRGGHHDRHGSSDLTDAQREERHAEHAARRAAFETDLFAEMDTDGNGELSAAEASRDNRQLSKQRLFRKHVFTRMDVDANGSLTRSEFQTRLQQLRSADINADNLLSRDEARALRPLRSDS